MNFRMGFYISVKNIIGILTRIDTVDDLVSSS